MSTSTLEAAYLTKEINIREQGPGQAFHGFGLPSGALLDNLRDEKNFAFSLIAAALVFVDRGPLRRVLLTVDDAEITEHATE